MFILYHKITQFSVLNIANRLNLLLQYFVVDEMKEVLLNKLFLFSHFRVSNFVQVVYGF